MSLKSVPEINPDRESCTKCEAPILQMIFDETNAICVDCGHVETERNPAELNRLRWKRSEIMLQEGMISKEEQCRCGGIRVKVGPNMWTCGYCLHAEKAGD